MMKYLVPSKMAYWFMQTELNFKNKLILFLKFKQFWNIKLNLFSKNKK